MRYRRRRHGKWVFAAGALGVGAVVATIVVTSGGQRTYLVAGRAASTTSPPVASTTSVATTSTGAVPTTSTAAPTTAPTTVPRAPASAVKPGSADSLLALALPVPSDLGPGWKALSLGPLQGDQSTWGPCRSPMWLPDTGAAALVLAYDDGAGHEAAATVTFFQATATDATAQQQAFTASPQVVPCLGEVVVADAPHYAWLAAPDASKVTPGSAPVSLHEPGDAELLGMTGSANGSPKSALWVFTHEYVGRYEAATEVTWCTCSPLPPAGLQHAVDIVGARVAALAAKFP